MSVHFFFPSIHLSNTQGHSWDTAQVPQGEGGLHPEQAPSFTTKRQTAIHAHIYRQFRVAAWPNVHVFVLWVESGIPGGKPQWH